MNGKKSIRYRLGKKIGLDSNLHNLSDLSDYLEKNGHKGVVLDNYEEISACCADYIFVRLKSPEPNSKKVYVSGNEKNTVILEIKEFLEKGFELKVNPKIENDPEFKNFYKQLIRN